MDKFQELIIDLLLEVIEETGVKQSRDKVTDILEVPPDTNMGDHAFPCFYLAREYRKAPDAIAGMLTSKLKDILKERDYTDLISKVEQKSGYVNFFLKKEEFVKDVIEKVQKLGTEYGKVEGNQDKTIVIDYSSPNIAKPFTVAHLRTTVIGNSIYKIFKHLGYCCVRVNHIGDWGTQFGKLIVAYKKWGKESKLQGDTSEALMELFSLYVRYHKEAEKDPGLDDEAREQVSRLENGDEEVRNLWKRFTEINLTEFKKVYKRMGIEFDSYAGESFYEDKMGDTLKTIKDKGITKGSQGALIVDLEDYQMPPCLLQKKDGTTLYATRDLCAAIYRYETYNFHKLLYVVGSEQKLHFNQVFKVVELMGYNWASRLHHIPFGLMKFAGGKMSSRKGDVVFLEELLNQAVKRTRQIIEEKNPDLDNKDEVSEAVGIGAVIFGDLRNNRVKDVVFEWDEILNFEGETGPYVQYTHARACSILRKADDNAPFEYADLGLLKEPEELAVIRAIADFPGEIALAAEYYEPSIVARALIRIASDFNSFYQKHRVLVDEKSLRQARLQLIDCARNVLSVGLGLLGMKAIEKM